MLESDHRPAKTALFFFYYSWNNFLRPTHRHRALYYNFVGSIRPLNWRQAFYTMDNILRNARHILSMFYYRRASGEDDESGEPWRIAVKTEDEKQRILESCHARVGGRLHACTVLRTRECSLHTIESHNFTPGGHLGRDKKIQKIESQFYWKNMNAEIRAYVEVCDKRCCPLFYYRKLDLYFYYRLALTLLAHFQPPDEETRSHFG